MKDIRKILVCLPIFILPFLFSELTLEEEPDVLSFHTEAELTAFSAMMVMDTILPDTFNQLFAASGVCVKCHSYDSMGLASVDPFGDDINVVDDWRATMMANSAKDPFWRAKVSHEVLLHEQHKEVIEDKCTSCHAPLGHFNAKHIGLAHYGMADLEMDVLGQDGVSCLACHQMSADSLGQVFSGEVVYDTFKVAYGPYEDPLVSPMLTETGYRPFFSEHTGDAAICAGCHSLITETIDYDGNFTGNKFVEQATYHEWLNSVYEDSISCQSCHMPDFGKWPVRLVTGAQTPPRSPFYQHEFVGGNVTMLKLLQNNIEQLDLKASAEQFDEVIEKTMDMLQRRSIRIELDMIERKLDTAHFELNLINLAGHKFPSGYPSRRAFIEFVVETEAGDTLFVSGKTDSEYEVFGHEDTYEPHYDTITSEQEVQIYELVLGDVNGDVTTVLERADHALKDNRLTPKGFSTTDAVYDTTLIAGKALQDENFNRENGVEGSGTDVVHYSIPLNGYYELLKITAKVYYQPTPPKWMKEMFDHSTPEIDAFREMFADTDRSPVLMDTDSIFAEAISNDIETINYSPFVKLYPIPSIDGQITIESEQTHELRVFNTQGQLVLIVEWNRGQYEVGVTNKGVFIFQFTNDKGQVQTERVMVE